MTAGPRSWTSASGAEADPVLRSDPTWRREEALVLADMDPPRQAERPSSVPAGDPARRRPTTSITAASSWTCCCGSATDPAVMIETDKLLKEGHNDWWLHYQRGWPSGRQGQKPEAIEEFDKALDVDQQADRVRPGGVHHPRPGDGVGWDEALKRVAPLLAPDPDGHWRLLQASMLRAKNDFDGADQVVDRAAGRPGGKPAERRVPLLRAKAEIWESRPAAEKLDQGPGPSPPTSRRATPTSSCSAFVARGHGLL